MKFSLFCRSPNNQEKCYIWTKSKTWGSSLANTEMLYAQAIFVEPWWFESLNPPKEACFGVQECTLQGRNDLAAGGAVALRWVDHVVISLVIGYVELWNIKQTICSSFTLDYGFMLSYLSRVCKLQNFCHGLCVVSQTFPTVKIPIFITSVNLLTIRFISLFVLASIRSITWKC